MKKIIVIGCPGSGKTTFAEKLRDSDGRRVILFKRRYENVHRFTI